MSTLTIQGRKVIVSRAGVASFNRGWPCSKLRDSRAYWFEFDADGDLIDTDCPESDDGPESVAMADDCKAFLFEGLQPEWAPDARQEQTPVTTTETEIREHMARAFFASAWADAAEEAGDPPRGEIMDLMPSELDPAAIKAADALAADLARVNGKSLDELMAVVERAGDGDRDNTAEMFGHYAAMQAMGHGVGLYDAFGSAVDDAIKVPRVEFGSLDLSRDYFSEDEESA